MERSTSTTLPGVPGRDHWLEASEKEAILAFERNYPLEGYRRLAFMMLDADVAAVSPSSVYRVLKDAGRIEDFNGRPSRKGTGFQQPRAAHEHWHVDVSYLNIMGTFYYLCSVLDGYSRAIIHWEIQESMTEAQIQIILQKAREMHPHATPRIISDNGPQFIANDFKQFIRLAGMTHVRTSPFYPQSNGKIERWHKSIKSECIRTHTPLSLGQARRSVASFEGSETGTRLVLGFFRDLIVVPWGRVEEFPWRRRHESPGLCGEFPGGDRELVL